MTHTNRVRNSGVFAYPVKKCFVHLLMLLLSISSTASLFAQTESIQTVDADTLHFYDEYQFRDFLGYHDLKHYSIKPQVDFYDCTVNSGTTIYTGQNDDDFLHEERFIDKPLIFIVDHNGTRKIYHILIPSTGDTTITTCGVQLTLTNPNTGQVVVFDDVYNWIDENGQNIFNMNKKMYFLWGFDSGNVDFPAEMLQLPTGIDFTFPDFFPEDTGPIHLIMTGISMYTQYTYYADMDGDGFGDVANDTMDYMVPPGFVLNSDDCDDTNAAVNPSGVEFLNGLDDDCNGIIDDYDGILGYTDIDLDGYGNDLEPVTMFELLPGFSLIGGDCDDYDSAIHPASVELCNGLDDNCNGLIDDGIINATTSPAGSVSFCAGSMAAISVADSEDFTYSWRKNGIVLAAETNATINVTSTGNYSVLISTDGGCSMLSSDVVVTVNNLPNAVITPVTDLNLCTGPGVGVAKLRTSAPAGSTIQWQKDGVVLAVPGTKTRTFSAAGTYQSIVTNAAGCTTVSAGVTIVNTCRETADGNDVFSEMQLSPVPADDNFLIRATLPWHIDRAVLNIFSLQGESVLTKELEVIDGEVLEWVDIQSIGGASCYIVRLSAKETVLTQLLIVNH